MGGIPDDPLPAMNRQPSHLFRLSSLPLLGAATLIGLGGTAPVHAQELYLKAGVPGVGIGFAQPLGPLLGVRADFVTLGDRNERRNEEGIDYDGTLKANRAALLLDMFPFAGSFRISAGATAAKYQLDLVATGAGGTLTIGNNTYQTTANDRFAVQVKMPSSMPYLGIGWGHQSNSGLRFSFDIGAAFGKAKVSYQLTGPVANQVSQQDIDAELAELRDGVAKVKAIPQVTFGIGYSF
jgi:hypothetical protein